MDVYAEPRGVDEGDRPPAQHPEPYGQHRLWLERQVQDAFPRVTVLRLPALFGPGLRKNFLYDLQQGKNLELTDHRSVFQFYDMNDLWADIQRILSMDLPLVHLVTEPMSASRVAAACFGHQSAHERTDREPAAYDVRTRYTKALGGSDGYLMDECAVLSRIRRWRASA